MNLIDKDALVAEIEKRLDELWDLLPNASDVIKDNYTKDEANITGKYTALESFSKFLNTLEVKEIGVKYYSSSESFGYPKMDTKHIPIVKHTPNGYDYECPHCGVLITSGFIESEVEYTDNGKTYPIYCNETLGFNGWGDVHDWEEIHCCNKCHKEFIITNDCF